MVRFIRNSLYLENQTLVASDLHLGYGRGRGLNLEDEHNKRVLNEIDNLLDKTGAKKLVISGDVYHSFGNKTRKTRRAVQELADLTNKKEIECVVTPGNHDEGSTFASLETSQWVKEAGFVISHGHEELPVEAEKGYIVGHLHPAVEVSGQKRECFLVSDDCNGMTAIVLPTLVGVGGVSVTGLLNMENRCPIVEDCGGVGSFNPVVSVDEDETKVFPKVGEIGG